MELLKTGAEAEVYRDGDTVIKKRPQKNYRHEEIDKKLRKQRTRKEIKILQKLETLKINAPKIISYSEEEATITMEYIEEDLRNQVTEENYKEIAKKISGVITQIHNNSIIHGDLTTANIVQKAGEIYLIDFGLTTESKKIEDKATDIHLLKQAIKSKYPTIFEQFMEEFLKYYEEKTEEGKEIINRLQKVEQRGRYKQKQ